MLETKIALSTDTRLTLSPTESIHLEAPESWERFQFGNFQGKFDAKEIVRVPGKRVSSSKSIVKKETERMSERNRA